MEIQLILGPNGSGKSLYAETLAVQNKDHPLIYIATMVPQTEDNLARIEKHRQQRAGKGFHTLEEPWEIDTLSVPADSVVLLEDASNLLANGIFGYHKNVSVCYDKIMTLAGHCKKLIIVSISGYTPGDYDEETNDYIRQLNSLNEMLKNISIEVFQF